MRTIKFFMVILFLTSFNLTFCQTSKSSEKISKTVLVMPFIQNEQYPYLMDEYRESIMNAFITKDFVVVTNDSIWSDLLDMNYDLSDISLDQAENIAEKTDVDLIIYGDITQIFNYRNRTFSSVSVVYKPILIKVYDAKKKSLVIYERVNINERWGLNSSSKDIYDLALNVARKLNDLGY